MNLDFSELDIFDLGLTGLFFFYYCRKLSPMRFLQFAAPLLVAGIFSLHTQAQSGFKEIKAGHSFNVSLPVYMDKTIGLNDAASLQFKNSVKDVAGIVVVDTKEELQMAELKFANPEEFYESFVKDFLVDEASKKFTKTVSKGMGKVNFVEAEASYMDTELNMEIGYFIGIAETPSAFYKVLCWGSTENEAKYKADFQKILYSIKD